MIGNRPRPHNPCDEDPKPANVRWLNLRGREGNKSMPSADTAQSALCAAFISLNYPAFYAFMGGMGFTLKLIIAVAIGRVYYHCHFVGDCIVGSIVGTVVAYFVHEINLAELVSRPLAQAIIPN